MKRPLSALEAEAKAYYDITMALNRYWKHPGTNNDDMQRLLAGLVARWFHYKVVVDITKG